jgi:hypothetical protein
MLELTSVCRATYIMLKHRVFFFLTSAVACAFASRQRGDAEAERGDADNADMLAR